MRLRLLRNALQKHDPAHFWEELSDPAKYVPYFMNEFKQCDTRFDLIRLLNNAFAHDVVPPKEVVGEMLHACRRLDQYGLALRTLEGVKEKADFGNHKGAYNTLLKEVEPQLKELGVEPIETIGKLEESSK